MTGNFINEFSMDAFESDDELYDVDAWGELTRSDSHAQRRRTRRTLECMTLLLLVAACTVCECYQPSNRVARPRLNWPIHLQYLVTESRGSFQRYYRMSVRAFVTLRTLLLPFLLKDEVMAFVCCQRDPIDATLTLHCLLRYLAGGAHDDIRILAGISQSSFYRAVHAGLLAVCLCPDLAYHFPYTPAEIHWAASNWAALSSHGVVLGCVGAMDGLLVRIRAPRRRETGHVRSYFSGHYHCYGILVLGVCDHMCRFIHLSVALPGGGADVNAFRNSNIRPLTDRLPLGRFVVADNAFIYTDTVVTPFSGSDATDPDNDTFNYHISQLRIRIEMTFGYMTTMWEILQKKLKIPLRNVGVLLNATTRIHNFCITGVPRC
eukprot:GHVU01155573.1.p1 GENE.GHVU01155573.1~~GHVU01155573.1.p1  ORF type:complete len:377 (+),score=15.75 GHVU01155573.1:241-1371(+)